MWKSKKGKQYTRLVIIGNGFDISHNLATTYSQFVTANMNKPAVIEYLEILKEVNIADKSDISWYEFEEQFYRIAIYYFEEFIGDDRYEDKIENANRIFSNISELLFDYLKCETESKHVVINQKLRKYFDDSTYAISFNYTDTPKYYCKNVNYVHGSISDDVRIILGFDKEMPCLFAGVANRFHKEEQREALNYYRYLRNNKIQTDYDDAIKVFMDQVDALYGARGEYAFTKSAGEASEYDLTDVPEYLANYAIKNQYSRYNEDMCIENVRELVIMGHGIKSDIDFIKEMVLQIKKLKKIVLFSYSGELIKEVERKKSTLRAMLKESIPIQIELY